MSKKVKSSKDKKKSGSQENDFEAVQNLGDTQVKPIKSAKKTEKPSSSDSKSSSKSIKKNKNQKAVDTQVAVSESDNDDPSPSSAQEQTKLNTSDSETTHQTEDSNIGKSDNRRVR